MQECVLKLENVKKTIKGREIIKGLDLELFPSEVFGFLGPNGAGKTTTIRMIVGLIKPTSGSIQIVGNSVTKNFSRAMSNVGCIIESPELYNFMSGIDNLEYFAAMKGNISKDRCLEVSELVGLKNRIQDKVKTYSLGMRQRLGLAQAILAKPRLLILDEPTNGLDPGGINEFRNLIKRLAHEDNISVFISSHLLSEIQLMCDRFAIIKQGMIIRTGKVSDIQSENNIIWKLSDTEKASEIMKNKYSLAYTISDAETISGNIASTHLEDINQTFIEAGIRIKFVYTEQKTLEDLFLDLTEGDEIV
jgi:ABC-2 type transport system ATP-binding protein